MALAAVLASDAYLRPGEVANLRVAHVVTAKPFLGKSALHTSLVLFPFEEGGGFQKLSARTACTAKGGPFEQKKEKVASR